MSERIAVAGTIAEGDPDFVQVGKIVEAVVAEVGPQFGIDHAAITMGLAFALTRHIARAAPDAAGALRYLDITIETMRGGLAEQLAGGASGGTA